MNDFYNLIIRRQECIEAICNVINQVQLPAFIIVDILERLASEMKKAEESELRQCLLERQTMQQNNSASVHDGTE